MSYSVNLFVALKKITEISKHLSAMMHIIYMEVKSRYENNEK